MLNSFNSGYCDNRSKHEVQSRDLDSLTDYPAAKPVYCTSMTRFRLVFDRLKDFLPSAIDNVIPLSQKILQPIKSLSDLTRQLVQYPA